MIVVYCITVLLSELSFSFTNSIVRRILFPIITNNFCGIVHSWNQIGQSLLSKSIAFNRCHIQNTYIFSTQYIKRYQTKTEYPFSILIGQILTPIYIICQKSKCSKTFYFYFVNSYFRYNIFNQVLFTVTNTIRVCSKNVCLLISGIEQIELLEIRTIPSSKFETKAKQLSLPIQR